MDLDRDARRNEGVRLLLGWDGFSSSPLMDSALSSVEMPIAQGATQDDHRQGTRGAGSAEEVSAGRGLTWNLRDKHVEAAIPE
jgi:hypothetical protein